MIKSIKNLIQMFVYPLYSRARKTASRSYILSTQFRFNSESGRGFEEKYFPPPRRRQWNFHPDTCLAKGTKRKLTQRTLLQFNFSPRSSDETYLSDGNDLNMDSRNRQLDDENVSSESLIFAACPVGTKGGNHRVPNPSGHSLSNSKVCTDVSVKNIITEDIASSKVVDPLISLMSSHSNSKVCTDVSVKNIITEDVASSKVADPLSSFMSSHSKRMPKLNVCGEKHAKSMEILETFIVARRFHQNILLQQGAVISVLRDPQNSKDGHAI